MVLKKVSFLGSLINVDAASYTGVEVEHLPVNYLKFCQKKNYNTNVPF